MFKQTAYYNIKSFITEIVKSTAKRLNDIFLMHFNVRNLQKNFDKLLQYLSDSKKLPDILSITKTKLKKYEIYGNIILPSIDSNLLTVLHLLKELLLCKKNLKFTIMNNTSIMLNGCENLWILIETE